MHPYLGDAGRIRTYEYVLTLLDIISQFVLKAKHPISEVNCLVGKEWIRYAYSTISRFFAIAKLCHELLKA
jgi:hypothetical protein